MKYFKKHFIAVLLLLIFLGAVFYIFKDWNRACGTNPSYILNKKILTIASTTIEVEVADTIELQYIGLSCRKYLASDSGMLFVFKSPDKYVFWMKDMFFPIDIIWLDIDKKVVYIKENALPESYPSRFVSTTPSLYVLEVNSGFVNFHNIKIGDRADF